MGRWSHAKEDGKERLYAKNLVFCLHLPAQDVHDLVTLHNDDIDACEAREAKVLAMLDRAYTLSRNRDVDIALFDVRKNIRAIVEGRE